MHFWYRAVCDKHKEAVHVFIRTNGTCFQSAKFLLGEYETATVRWLEEHSGCNLRLIHRDDELEEIKPHLLEVYHDPSGYRCLCTKCKGNKK